MGTQAQGKILLESVELELSVVRLWMCLHSGGSIRPSGFFALELVRLPSGISSLSLGVSVMSSLTQPRAALTATPSRRRMSWSVWPNPTDNSQLSAGSVLREILYASDKISFFRLFSI